MTYCTTKKCEGLSGWPLVLPKKPKAHYDAKALETPKLKHLQNYQWFLYFIHEIKQKKSSAHLNYLKP